MPVPSRMTIDLLKRAAEPVLYHGDRSQPRGLKRLSVRANQALFERGIAPPWIWSPEQCRAYWAGQSNDSIDPPINYANKPQAIVDALHDFWRPQVEPDMSILEIGCNAGANLAGLHRHGYRDLAAVEINPHAIKQLHRSFPDLPATIMQGAFEDVLPGLPSDSVDVVFSMAVLIHVHPRSNAVLEHMARIARRYVCVMEAEAVTVSYIFARNYRRAFERLGCAQLQSVRLTEQAHPELTDVWGYTMRLLSAPI